MRVLVNERHVEVPPGTTLASLAAARKPGADVWVLNGHPATGDALLREGDRVVLVRRGEIPPREELAALLGARNSPGVAERLAAARVGIAGCGGLGSTVALALARAGVGHLVLADFDVVEPSNLNRQQYFVDQIGQPKVEALRATLARANPCVEVTARAVRLDPVNIPDLFEGVDVVVEAFDRADDKLMLVETMAEALPQIPVVMGSGLAGWGATGLLRVHRAGQLRVCGDERAEAGPGMGLMAPRVGVVACMEANEVLEILLGPDPHFTGASRPTPGADGGAGGASPGGGGPS